jgi:hypothetical protein
MALPVIVLLFIASMQAATPADSAIFTAFKQADAALAHFVLLQRAGVTDELDLVMAMGSSKAIPIDQNSPTWWNEDQTLGLFLQEKARPGRVYSLGTKPGIEECAIRIERVTVTDAVISCEAEKVGRFVHQKWVYDVRAKKLVGQLSYHPFAMHRIFPNGAGAVFIGSDRHGLVAVGFTPGREPECRVLSNAESAKWFRRVPVAEGTEGTERVLYMQPEPFRPLPFGPSGSFRLMRSEGDALRIAIEEQSGNKIRSYPFPQSTYDEFAAARPTRVGDGYVREQTRIEEDIGPWKLEEDKLWFGKSFYDGEGRNGVGGFGNFSATDREYHLFKPPEIAGWSVSAIDVESDAVWMALVASGEYGGSSGGLLRYDRQTESLRRIELPDIGVQFIHAGGKLLAATDFGIAVIEGDGVKFYFVDRTSDGRLRVVPAVH